MVLIFKYEFVNIPKCVIGGYDNLFSWFQSGQHLVIPRVLSANANVSLVGKLPAFINNVNPLSTRALVETASGYQNGLL